MKRLLLMAVLLFSAGVALADLEKGLAAIERRDWAAALAEFRSLAERGDADAQVNLGNLYMKGYGVPQDYGEAFRWYLKAAGQGNAMGQGKLGLMYYYGLGVHEDHAEAVRWFRDAAEKGEPGARSILGSLFATGDGVEKDKIQAYFWYSLAADRGSQDALDSRNGLVDEMSPGEINEALSRLSTWRKRNEPAAETEAAGAGRVSLAPGKNAGAKAKRKKESRVQKPEKRSKPVGRAEQSRSGKKS